MSISFSCDFCSRKYRVDESLSGRKVKCKECGTDLTIPGGGAVVLSEDDYAPKAQSPHRDLYGLDDEDSPVAAPIPRRPGSVRSSGGRGGSSGGSSSTQVMWSVIGGGVFLLIVLTVAMVTWGGGQKPVGVKPIAAAPAPDRIGNAPAPSTEADPGSTIFAADSDPEAPAAASIPGAQAPNIFISLSNGRSFTATTPIGTPTRGVEFRVDYQVTGERPIGMNQYYAVVKSRNSRATARLNNLMMASGTIGGPISTMSQGDGPFELYFEGELPGAGGNRRYKISDTINMVWGEPPARQNLVRNGMPGNMPGMPGNMPGQPGYRPPGMPTIGQPGNMPGQPGYRPPGMPNIGQPGNMPGQPGYRPPGMPSMPRYGRAGRP